jgi:phospholipid/cholesterol/gamma-HCH transport system permease protein
MSVPATKARPIRPAEGPQPSQARKKPGFFSRLSMLNEGVVLESIRKLGIAAIFFAELLPRLLPAMARPRLIVQQVYNCGARSLSIIMLSGLFVGLALTLQGFTLLQQFGSADYVGVLAVQGLLRELGPVLTALLFAGRAGTALTSEIGLMRATDQLTAMQMMAVDPLRYVAAPRFLGGIIAMPLLVAIFNAVGLMGAHLVGVEQMGVNRGSFWSLLQQSVELSNVWESLVKGVVFGVVCSLVAVNEGYHSEPTAAGVGLATTRTVVQSSVLILFFDYVITALFF